MTRYFFPIFILICALAFTPACQKQEEPPKAAAPATVADQNPAAAAAKEGDEPPPAPPIREDFEGEPKLSLFPRVGDFCPEETDKEGQSYWMTFIDHLQRTSGPIKGKNGTGFAIRGIKTIDSVGFFSPLAVKPETSYRVSFRAWAKLPKGGQGGAGILEFDEFLWIAGQYPKSLSEKHFQRAQVGVQLTGSHDGTTQSFVIRTGPKTRMIHLVFFREGTPDREPMVIDDIEIKAE
ncbi:MAG: hypothetical protein NDI73_06565 [Desulfuromonadales bacterium]|nr:hypothetical protein [Desulfuromonadales bacterium]